MCTGAEIMLASAVFSGVGTAVSAVGAMQASAAQKNAYEYQAAVSRNNAKIAEWQAQDALRRGQQQEDDQRRKTAALKGSQRATLAARGLDIGEGSALNILTDTDYLGEQDAMTIRNNANKQAWAARVGASNDMANAELLSMRAGAENPLMSGASTLLSGAGSVADRWYKYKA
jgi:hypothetical protein